MAREKKPPKVLPEFAVYPNGFLYCIVCTSLGLEEAKRRVNIENPAGTTGGWQFADDDEDTPENPVTCKDSPKTHKHYLFVC